MVVVARHVHRPRQATADLIQCLHVFRFVPQAANGQDQGLLKPIIIGKPQPEMMVQALARMGGDASNTAVLGDRLDTDILAGRNAGLPTILVLTGVSGRDEAETGPIRPDFIFKDIGEVADALRASREALTATATKENS